MHYLEVKRVQKIIAFLRMIISHIDAKKSGEEIDEESFPNLLEGTYDDAMPYAIFINMQINQYLNAVKDYMAGGLSLEDASDRCTESLDTSKYVSLYKKETISSERVYKAYQFLPFGIITIVFSGVLPVVLSFNGTEKKFIFGFNWIRARGGGLGGRTR